MTTKTMTRQSRLQLIADLARKTRNSKIENDLNDRFLDDLEQERESFTTYECCKPGTDWADHGYGHFESFDTANNLW